MKKLFVFAYCEGELTQDVVFYDVKVGISRRDRAAFAYIKSKKATAKFFLAQRDNAVQRFIEQCAASLFPKFDQLRQLACIRRKQVEVTWLAKFIRTAPLTLLNSSRIDCLEKHHGQSR